MRFQVSGRRRSERAGWRNWGGGIHNGVHNPYEWGGWAGRKPLSAGRERELVELRQLLHRTRALTLCGPGGIGKTRLALRLLASAAAEFPDGVWFVELADLRQLDLQQADLVVSRVAAVLGITEEAG